MVPPIAAEVTLHDVQGERGWGVLIVGIPAVSLGLNFLHDLLPQLHEAVKDADAQAVTVDFDVYLCPGLLQGIALG